jgi:signal transduction histidine kinase
MQRIVDDLLDPSRLESGRWLPEVAEVDFHAVAEEVLTGVKRTADEKGLLLETSVDIGATVVVADRTAVRQILSNLVENAVRHTSNGSITVFAERDNSGVWIGVRDTGPGIAAEHLTRIFERFYRVDVGRDRDSGGTGLGLAIVKHLVEAHGGRVTASSEPGMGTRIAVFFPDRSITD